MRWQDEEAGEARRGHSSAVPLQGRSGGCVRCCRGSRGWSRLRRRRWGIWRRVIDGLFMGSADGFAPVIRAEGVDVFALGEVQGLDEGLAEIGKGGGGFGFHLTLGDGGEEASEGGAEIAGGHKAAGKVIGDVLAGGLASKGLCVLAGVEGAEIRMGGLSRNAAVAAIGKGERTQRGTVLGVIGGHGSLQKERLDFGIFVGSLAEARRTTERKQCSRVTITMSIKLR